MYLSRRYSVSSIKYKYPCIAEYADKAGMTIEEFLTNHGVYKLSYVDSYGGSTYGSTDLTQIEARLRCSLAPTKAEFAPDFSNKKEEERINQDRQRRFDIMARFGRSRSVRFFND